MRSRFFISALEQKKSRRSGIFYIETTRLDQEIVQ